MPIIGAKQQDSVTVIVYVDGDNTSSFSKPGEYVSHNKNIVKIKNCDPNRGANIEIYDEKGDIVGFEETRPVSPEEEQELEHVRSIDDEIREEYAMRKPNASISKEEGCEYSEAFKKKMSSINKIMGKKMSYRLNPLPPISEEDKNGIINIMEKVLKEHKITDINVSDYKKYLERYEDNNNIILFNNKNDDYSCPFSKYFKNRTKYVKRTSFCAFKLPCYAREMLEKDELCFTNLKMNENNDSKEYKEFWRIIGKAKKFNHDIKQIFIYCLTDKTMNKDNEASSKMWEKYGSNEKNVCIEYSLEQKTKDNYGAFKCGRICYNDGSDFNFLKEINKQIKKKYKGLFFSPSGWTTFALFYKRIRYSFENETRLSLDLRHKDLKKEPIDGIRYKHVTYEYRGKYRKGIVAYIEREKNQFISWNIKSVTFGKKCNPECKRAIIDILKNNSIYRRTKIIERK